MANVHRYILALNIPLTVDQFSFSPYQSTTSEFVFSRGLFFKEDVTRGLEKVPISCVNVFDSTKPNVIEKNNYAALRVPAANVKINTDASFLVCCDCQDDCSDPKVCACQLLTEFQVGSYTGTF